MIARYARTAPHLAFAWMTGCAALLRAQRRHSAARPCTAAVDSTRRHKRAWRDKRAILNARSAAVNAIRWRWRRENYFAPRAYNLAAYLRLLFTSHRL